MTDTSDPITFSIERDGKEYDVDVSREMIVHALGSKGDDAEALAGWFQGHLDKLGAIAREKIEAAPDASQRVTITAADWAEAQ